MTSIRLKIEESWYASMDCKVQKSGPWVCFYGGHSTGYKLGNHPKNIEPCAHRARTVRAPCAHRATTPPNTSQQAPCMALKLHQHTDGAMVCLQDIAKANLPYPPPPPLQSPPLRGWGRHFDISSVKSEPATPAAKRAGNRAAQPTSSSNPQPLPELPTEHVQEFKVVWSCKKKFHTVPVERARA